MLNSPAQCPVYFDQLGKTLDQSYPNVNWRTFLLQHFDDTVLDLWWRESRKVDRSEFYQLSRSNDPDPVNNNYV